MSMYIDMSDGAMGEIAETLKHKVEAIAKELREEIYRSMEPGEPRTGREYPMPSQKGTYTASAPGETPATRTGRYAASWQPTPAVVVGDKVIAAVMNDAMDEKHEHFIGELMEYGTETIAPRPHIRPAMDAVAQRHGGTVKVGE